MPQGMGYEKYDSAGKPKKAGSKSPIDMGNSIVGKRRAAFEREAVAAPKKKSAKSAEGIIGKTGGRMVGGYAPTGRGKANSRVAQTSWSKAGGARQNKKKGKSLPTTK